jgi:predicted transcriptional regulator
MARSGGLRYPTGTMILLKYQPLSLYFQGKRAANLTEGKPSFGCHNQEVADVTINVETLLGDLEAANVEALSVYKANKASDSGIESVAFDARRYKGLKQAIKIVGALASPTSRQRVYTEPVA